MNTILIAIDPGQHGGIAWSFDDDIVDAIQMPETMTGIYDQLQEISASGTVRRVLIEKTGMYRPGNSGPSAVKFARHCGYLEMAVYALGLPCEQVAPSKWMKSFLGAVPKDKKERKHAIKEKVQRLYPYLPVTLLTADALGLLTVLRNSMEK